MARRSVFCVIIYIFLCALCVPAFGEGNGGLYVLKPVVNLRNAPTVEGKKIASLERNMSLCTLGKQGRWVDVLAASGQKGWARSDLLSNTVVIIHKKERTLSVVEGEESCLVLHLIPGRQY